MDLWNLEQGVLHSFEEDPKFLERREGNWIELIDKRMLDRKPNLSICSNHKTYKRITRYHWPSWITGTYRRKQDDTKEAGRN